MNTIGPVWEGNRVWLILGAGVIFAAWPMLYAIVFSSFYLAMFLALAALILRPVSFKFHSEVEYPLWRSFWASPYSSAERFPPWFSGLRSAMRCRAFRSALWGWSVGPP
jgi:cytochrome d oxidase subunit CydB